MTQVKYDGTSDFQIFTKSDFEKAGVEDQGKVTFAKGEPTEVSEAAAAALLSTNSSESIFHDFSFSEVDEEDQPKGAGEENPDGSNEDADTSGSTSSDTSGSTGAGTSTRGGSRSGRGSRSTGGSTT